MDIQDLKIYVLNSFSLIMSMTQIEMALKIVLLLVSIGYTAAKWYEMVNKRK